MGKGQWGALIKVAFKPFFKNVYPITELHGLLLQWQTFRNKFVAVGLRAAQLDHNVRLLIIHCQNRCKSQVLCYLACKNVQPTIIAVLIYSLGLNYDSSCNILSLVLSFGIPMRDIMLVFFLFIQLL